MNLLENGQLGQAFSLTVKMLLRIPASYIRVLFKCGLCF